MRKKSHISLARYIVESADIQVLRAHKKAFCLGNILPDCKPSFLTTKHEYNKTFDLVKEDIEKLTEYCGGYEEAGRVYFRDLGQVIHYMADFFTFPHNEHYAGNLKAHCKYEKRLKHHLRKYLREGQALKNQDDTVYFEDCSQLITFIQNTHAEYVKFKRSVEEDCIFIVNLCSQIVFGILYLFGIINQPEGSVVFA